MSNYVESLIEKALTPDSDVIKQATKQLMEYFVSEKCFNGLFEVLSNSKTVQAKIYAANLLRKKVKNWKTIQDSDRSAFKIQVLNLLVREQDESVRKQIMWLIASAYKYCVKSKQEWPELLKFINEFLTSCLNQQVLSGAFMLSILNEESAEQMKPHFVSILKIYQRLLSESDDMKCCFYVISGLKSMIPFTDETEANDLNNLLSNALTKSIALIKSDEKEETVTTVFEFFQTLVEYDIPIVLSYIKTITEIVLERFILDSNLKKSTRVCAMNLLNVLIETQKTNLIKNELIRPIVNVIFLIMCQSKEPLQIKSDVDLELDDNDNQEETNDETENLFTAATQVLDYCAIYFPPKKFIRILIEYVSPSITSENELHRRAALAALAITTEGCAEYYRNHYLELLTDLCIKGMQDSSNQVVQLSYFALCQFSEFLQPDLNQFSKRIMNIIIDSIETKIQLRSANRLAIRFYDALESYCESLGDDLIPYVPTLMSKLMTLETICSSSLKIKRYILSIFSSIVCSVKHEFTPYFDYAVQLMKPYLFYNQMKSEQQSDMKLLQIESIDLMGIMAKHVSKEKFNDAIIENCLSFVQNVLNNDSDPDIRSAAYDLLAGLASKLKENLQIKELMPKLIETLKSEEGISIIDKKDNNKEMGFNPFDEIDLQDDDEYLSEEDQEEEDEEDNEEDMNDFTYNESDKLIIDNEYAAEKLSAIYCLEEISKYQNKQLFEFYSEIFTELKILTSFLHLDVRCESFLAIANLISYYYENKVKNSASSQDALVLNRHLNEFYSKSIKIIRKEANRKLVMNVFDSIRILLLNCANYFKTNLNLFDKQIESYGMIVLDAFEHKLFCQEIAKEQEFEEDEAECYKMLKEYAGDIIPSLAMCLPDSIFDVYFQKFLNHLLAIFHKADSTNAELSFVIGVIGESCANMESIPSERANQLLNEFYKYLGSKDDEIRSNTIFTIGSIFYNSTNNTAMHQFYAKAIEDLIILAKTEQNKQSLDNICGTLCRLCLCCMKASIPNIDYQILFKIIFLDLTPLKFDFTEYFTLFTLINQSIEVIVEYYPRLLELTGLILTRHQYESKKGTKELIVNFLKYLNLNFKQEFDGFVGQLKENVRNEIIIAITCN